MPPFHFSTVFLDNAANGVTPSVLRLMQLDVTFQFVDFQPEK
jgi:hypothetical protein